ncbi:caspase family protein [Oligoflexus tunisiensis]|uniref:caspase family protein n=1 Tax=Oligoflexus tunisiensis TaxID=708132 RepID=UPI001C402614|nr:caspase family protein [Oligoflexus tunisiensis]
MLRANEARTVLLAIGNKSSYKLGLPQLEFTQTDMGRVKSVLQRIGGVRKEDTFFGSDVSYQQLRSMIQQIQRHIAAIREPVKFVLYYSGHSDSEGLHLLDRELPRAELHQWLQDVKAKTKLVFLDSCFAGALTAKGIKMETSFALPKAHFDEPSGIVFLAATSESEFAYEIGELEGSLFTHYLVSGLYGQADSNDDGLVTIDEIYQYVFREMKLYTLTLPSRSQQRPQVDINLKGQGTLVVTRPQKETVRLILGPEVYGTVLLAQEKGAQIFRVDKAEHAVTSIRVLPGRYKIAVSNTYYRGHGLVDVLKDNETIDLAQLKIDRDFQSFLVSKGHVLGEQWTLALGIHQGVRPLSNNGPFLEIGYQWSGVNIRGLWVRPTVSAAVRQNPLQYRGNSGISRGMGGLLGIMATGRLFAEDHRHWFIASMNGGAEIEQRNWNTAPPDEPATQGSKFAFSLGYRYLRADSTAIHLFFRREGIFLEGPEESMIAFSASLIGAGLVL